MFVCLFVCLLISLLASLVYTVDEIERERDGPLAGEGGGDEGGDVIRVLLSLVPFGRKIGAHRQQRASTAFSGSPRQFKPTEWHSLKTPTTTGWRARGKPWQESQEKTKIVLFRRAIGHREISRRRAQQTSVCTIDVKLDKFCFNMYLEEKTLLLIRMQGMPYKTKPTTLTNTTEVYEFVCVGASGDTTLLDNRSKPDATNLTVLHSR